MAATTEEAPVAGAPPEDGEEKQGLAGLAENEPDVDEEPEQFVLFGTQRKLNANVGKPRITESAARFTAKRQKLPGQFDLGETVRGTWVGHIKDIQFPGKKNSDDSVEYTRVHVIEVDKLSQDEMPEGMDPTLDGRGSVYADEIAGLRARVKELEAQMEA